MSLGDEWSEATTGSASKLNLTTVTFGTGAYLAGLDKTKHKLLVCTSTGSGFTLDHVYLCSTDGTQAIDLSDVNEHFHTSSTTGGALIDILFYNTIHVDTGPIGFMNAAMTGTGDGYFYRQAVTGTGAITNQQDGTTNERYLELDTGATNASVATVRMPINIQMDFTKRSVFQAKHKIGTASSIAIKCGYGAESLSSADNNSRKYGAECCTTVNNNWFAFSADGTTRSSSDTGTAFTTNKRGITCYHFPDIPKIDLVVEPGTTYFTKTSNIPITNDANQPDRDSFFQYSIKNNTAASRKFNWYGVRCVYSVKDDSGIL